MVEPVQPVITMTCLMEDRFSKPRSKAPYVAFLPCTLNVTSRISSFGIAPYAKNSPMLSLWKWNSDRDWNFAPRVLTMIFSSAKYVVDTVRQRNYRNGKPPRFCMSSCRSIFSVMIIVVRSDSMGFIHLGNLGILPKILRYWGTHAKSTMISIDIPVESMCSSWIFFRLHKESTK